MANKKPDLNLNALDRESRLLRSQLSEMKCLFDQNKDEENKQKTIKKLEQVEDIIVAIQAYKKMVSNGPKAVKD